MSAIAAHYASVPDRRYPDLAYDPPAFFHYPHHTSLNAVTSPLDPSYSSPASSYLWDDAYSSSSSSLSTAYPPSPSSSAHPGPPALSAYPQQHYAPTLRLPSSRSAPANLLPSPSSPPSRPSYPAPSRSYSLAPPSIPSSSSRLQNAHWSDSNQNLYTILPADPLSAPLLHPDSPPPTTPSPPIKEEDAEAAFIIEVTVPAEAVISPMPEVPLRATHAPPTMRKMMYSFRLENFATHDGIRSAATQPGPGGIEVGPLKEKPVELEWQLHLDHPLLPDQEQQQPYAYQSQRYSAPRASSAYRNPSPASSRQSATRTNYAPTASPAPSADYPSALDSDPWEASSGYESVAGNSSSSASTESPTFTSVMTPAQSLGWTTGNLRYTTSADVDLDASPYRRPSSSMQSSLSRVSQTHGQYARASEPKSAYHQTPPFGYESSAYSRAGSSSRYAPELYASSSSTFMFG